MAKLTIAPKITEKIMRRIRGEKGSPFESVDNLGKLPDYRNPTDSPGTEKKKLKQAGEKISKFFKKMKKKEKDFPEIKDFKSGGRVCKLAKRGKGKAYGKNS
jgi:hypothetical protein